MSTNEMATNLYPQTIKIMPLKLVKSEETKKKQHDRIYLHKFSFKC